MLTYTVTHAAFMRIRSAPVSAAVSSRLLQPPPPPAVAAHLRLPKFIFSFDYSRLRLRGHLAYCMHTVRRGHGRGRGDGGGGG